MFILSAFTKQFLLTLFQKCDKIFVPLGSVNRHKEFPLIFYCITKICKSLPGCGSQHKKYDQATLGNHRSCSRNRTNFGFLFYIAGSNTRRNFHLVVQQVAEV